MNSKQAERIVRLVIGSAFYQAVWFAAVLSALDPVRWWWGPLSACIYLGLAVLLWPDRRRHMVRMVVVALGMGLVIDTALSMLGAWSALRVALPAPLTPLWLLALWCAFGTYISLSLDMLYGRYAVSALVGAIGGTLAYRGGVVFGAVAWGQPAWHATLLMAITWAIVFPILTGLAGKSLRAGQAPVRVDKRSRVRISFM